MKTKLDSSDILTLKRKFKGYTINTPHYTYGQWVGVEIECFLDPDLVPSRLTNSDGECHGDHDCDCDLSEARADWINENHTAFEVLHMSDRERQRVDDRSCDAIYCEEIHCDCSNEGINMDEMQDYFHRLGLKSVSCESDGSIRAEDNYLPIEFQVNFEINSPEPLKRLLIQLNEWGARVNKSCGIHVHFDKRNRKIVDVNGQKEVALWFSNNLDSAGYFKPIIPLFQSIVPESRKKDNQYCVPVASSSKYSYVNLLPKNTIEFRFFNGSVNFDKIMGLCNMLNETIKMYPSFDINKFTPTTKEWIENRQKEHPSTRPIEKISTAPMTDEEFINYLITPLPIQTTLQREIPF